MLMFLIMRNGGGFHRSFLAAAVDYAIRFVFCSSTVAVFLLILCFLDRTLANLQGVLLDGRHPFNNRLSYPFRTDNLAYFGQIILPMGAVRYTDAGIYIRSAY